jgi:hypothetical protein
MMVKPFDIAISAHAGSLFGKKINDAMLPVISNMQIPKQK